MRIAVFGGMNMDILGIPKDAFALRDSIIGTVRMVPGGVGRNIAQHLAAVPGIETQLVTALGSDDFARQLENDCQQKHILLTHALRVNAPSPVYLAIHDAEGDMAAAINDMKALDALTPQAMDGILQKLSNVDCGVLDANLSEHTLLAIAEKAHFPLIADPVSVEKSHRLLPLLHRLWAIKPNLLEAQAMTSETKPEYAAQALLQKGVRQVFISLGEKGLYYAAEKASGLLPAQKIAHGYLTGAGDALCAGLVLALANRQDAATAAHSGQNFAVRYLMQTIDKGERL